VSIFLIFDDAFCHGCKFIVSNYWLKNHNKKIIENKNIIANSFQFLEYFLLFIIFNADKFTNGKLVVKFDF
jgi:hypothetical protein